jgi:putative methyltransferase (TIGR04325 family)
LLMAQGSLQYLPDTLPDRLKKLAAPPRHIILNLTPLHDRLSYFTLQSIGAAFCPYRITAILDFTKSFEALGYKMVDHWNNPDKSCPIPFYPEHSLEGYHGFYFCREG